MFVEADPLVASMIHDADMIYNSFPTAMNPKLAHPPSWYWFNHCYATFMTDPAGLELLHRIGADRVMWSSDYPHQESTFGYTRSAIQAVFDATTVRNDEKILGKHRARCLPDALMGLLIGDRRGAGGLRPRRRGVVARRPGRQGPGR